MREKWDAFMGRAGFFVTLAICLLVAGVSGYFLLFDKDDTPPPQESLVVEETVAPIPEPVPETTPKQESALPVIGTLLSDPTEIAEEVTSMPEVPIDDTPVVAEAPQLMVSPLEGEVLTVFSIDALVYSETLEDWRTHDGVDLSAPAGTSVLAACAGTVLSVKNDILMGTTVTISHHDGYETSYSNLEEGPPVVAGDVVSAGEVIGTVGTTAAAESAQEPHLHFSVKQDGLPVDPDSFLQQ